MNECHTQRKSSQTAKVSLHFTALSTSNGQKKRPSPPPSRYKRTVHVRKDPTVWYASEYDPSRMGSIDGTGNHFHDKALLRASKLHFDPKRDSNIKGDATKTLFIGRLHSETSQDAIYQLFSSYGPIAHVRLVRDIVTKASKGYAFVEYRDRRHFERALEDGNDRILDGRKLLVDYERSRLMPGWKPRRMGGGLGGKKESGQLRFGGVSHPFKRPHFRSGRGPLT
uniref:U11/U12 small nuclear ribonucleoprotein 35 kDa protein putative n=1 Tax=Albugo laibachii Nc14 TaxID=890382 RepID=F0W0A4_9STRA|nr:U11/U12 small nuclear ribonucleoprotein 35 kDa protein putative [Albugo laibachii Nc14]|eukprot:CCA14475.1 U11/U12 small nuclear ribonucleoprotein 35 kDa protein putative [Albugo laibachii Nc14]